MEHDGEVRAIGLGERPATVASLAGQLTAVGVVEGDIVLVHSSLSALGWVAGGAQAVVEALLAAVGPDGTIVMPTQSGQLSDPAAWSNPPLPKTWIDEARDALPAFDPHLTPTRGMGAIVECFRADRRTMRSPHPLLSFAALGPKAAEITGDHPVVGSFGMGSPLGRLYDLDAKVLLMAVDHSTTTALHLAEDRAEWPGRRHEDQGAPVLVDGERRWIEYRNLFHDDTDFAAIGEQFAATGAENSGPLGAGTGRSCSLRALVDFGVEWLEHNRR